MTDDRKRRGRVPVGACGHCGEARKCPYVILEVAVCQRCRLRFGRTAKPCPGCGHTRVLAYFDGDRRPVCARCTGNRPIYACKDCGREDSPSFGRRCGPCELRIRLTDLLADNTGGVHPRLQPVFDALMAAPRPQSTLYWLTRTSSRPDLLRGMARGELAISHATFDAIPLDRAVTYVRDMLAAVGVLPPYHPSIERITLWLEDTVGDLPKDRADLVRRFARWQLLHRLRLLGERDTLTRSSVQGARTTILTTIRFLAWLDTQQVDLADVGQRHLDHYLVTHAGHGPELRLFLDWTNRSGLTTSLTIPYKPRSEPDVALSDTQRWLHVEVLLHDDTVRLYTRVAGLFILLFAQPLSRVLRMRPEQIARSEDGTVTVAFDTFPIELPEPLEELALRQLDASQNERFAGHHRKWLFPGRNAGRHLVRENIRSELVARGIHLDAGRKAALFQLAGEVPTPVLAELLGIAPSTATRWAALSARDWSHYASLRRTPPAPDPPAA